MADDEGRAGRSAAWGILAAVFAACAVGAWQVAIATRSKFFILPACGSGLVAVIGLYMCFATMWHWWPPARRHVGTPADPQALRTVTADVTGTAADPAIGNQSAESGASTSVGEPGQAGSVVVEAYPARSELQEPPEPEMASKPVRLAPRLMFLAGREELLADLHTRLTGGDAPWPRVGVLHGLGGTGKTSLAVEYAHRRLAEVGLAWQFAVEDPAALTADFSILQAQLGIRDPSDAVASVHSALASFSAEWLLIFDNVSDRSAIEAFLPPAGRGRVLITSQNELWPFRQGIDVPVLKTDVAADFLMKRTSDTSHQSARLLAELLGGLPLALEQAAAYIHATDDNLAGYLSLFRRRRSDVLARGNPTGYDKTIATTWRLAFERLQQASPEAVGLLRLVSFCAPEAIPLRLLLAPRAEVADRVSQSVAPVLMPLLEDELVARDAVAALRQYSLATPAGEGLVSVHRLVQAVTLDQMSKDLASQWRRAVAVTIESALPVNSKLPSNWPAFAALLPHAQAVLAPHAVGLTRIADYLGRSGSYLAARDLYQRVADAQTTELGTEATETLASLNGLARWTGQTGNAAGARDMLAQLLPVEERVLGPEHPLTLETRSSIARWTGQAGDPPLARDLFVALLLTEERVLGPEDPETLDTRSAVARWTGEAGNATTARDLFAKALPIEERVLGHDHPQTLDTRSCIARWTGHAGNPGGARDQLTALMPQIVRVLGPEHPRPWLTKTTLPTGHGRQETQLAPETCLQNCCQLWNEC